MSVDNSRLRDTTIEILGKTYKVKCPEDSIIDLQKAANYLEEKMIKVQESGVINADKIAVITALNVINQLFALEQKQAREAQDINQRVLDLHSKVDNVLAGSDQLEFNSAE